MPNELTPIAQQVLDELMEGNERFVSGRPRPSIYSPTHLQALSEEQAPKVAIIACSDSRSSPDIIFDQPLGTIFASRVPGNVASDSAKWMLEIAIGVYKVPLVMVMGHTGCLAVGQLLDGDKGGAGGMHRFVVMNAVYKAKSMRPDDLYQTAVEENAKQTVEHLVRDLYSLRSAVLDGTTSVVSTVYDMPTGQVKILERGSKLYGKY